MKKSVYLDTTIPSYYYDERGTLNNYTDATRSWWAEERKNYKLFTSDYTLVELEQGNYPRKKEIMALLENIPVLSSDDEIENIAEIYMKEYVMPKGSAGDAFHLASASFHKIDYLLTWNCNHLANANKDQHIRVVNTKLGIFTPAIVTPIQLFREKD
jgi:predicted nucleic acid-binding protein